MRKTLRYDVGELRKAEVTSDGFLRAPALISRTGIYQYAQDDGSIVRELRTPEEVFHPDSLASFALAPVTDGHPPEGYIDATTARQYARGSIGEVVQPEGSMVRATIMVTDADLVKKILDGDAQEVSCGYTCEIVDESGEWNGQPYDRKQVNIKGNHIAVVPVGRAGPAARVKLDAQERARIPLCVETFSPYARADADDDSPAAAAARMVKRNADAWKPAAQPRRGEERAERGDDDGSVDAARARMIRRSQDAWRSR